MSIHAAARAGQPDELARLIAEGVDINERDHTGKTALHWAGAPVDATAGVFASRFHFSTSSFCE